MSVIAFYGNDKIETAQTASMAGISTYLSIEENYKILLINTKYIRDRNIMILDFKIAFGHKREMKNHEQT